MSPKLQSVIELVKEVIPAMLTENSANIDVEFDRDVIKAAKVEKPAATTINISIKVSHQNKPCKFKLRYGSAQSDEAEENLKDPNQLELPAGE